MSDDSDAELLVLSRTPPRARVVALVSWAGAGTTGLIALLTALGVPAEGKVGGLEREVAERVMVAVWGGVALAFGALGVLMLSRRETVIDRRHRLIIRRWNLLGWRRERRWSLDSVTHVEVRAEANGSSCYPVLLCGEGLAIPVVRPMRQVDGSGEIAARHDADQVARFLGLDLHDRT